MKVIDLRIGQRFEQDEQRPYTEGGVKGIHGYTLVCEVTDLRPNGFAWKVVKVTEETGRPSFARTPAVAGSTAWFALPLYIARGTLRLV